MLPSIARPAEAAVVARVTLRDVNRAIDERILPDGLFTVEGARHVLVSACTLISFYFASAKQLIAEERLFAVSGRPDRACGNSRPWPRRR
jgi:hypothetical protein